VSCDKTRITYSGPELPGAAEEIVLFSSTVAFGSRAATHYGCFWFDVSLQTDENADNEMQLQKSIDGGATWVDVDSAVTAGDGHTLAEFFVSPYADWRVVYTNGTTPQTLFGVDMVIDHTSRASSAP